MSAQSHRSDPRILGRRTLARDHRILAELMKPGLSVLDIGCGTGAITFGIAQAVGPAGSVLGIDRDETLLALARQEHAEAHPNLTFARGDATALNFHAEFDIVTAARTLQWIANPALAISKMRQAAKPGGLLVALDYNHADNSWDPAPPAEFQLFYHAFLAWREANSWDNRMADHLSDLFRAAGLDDIRSYPQDEVTERGDPQFAQRTAIWSEVIESLGDKLSTTLFCSATQLTDARAAYNSWVATDLIQQVLAMRAVTGRVP